MCVDHAGLALFPSASAFRCVGRLAFPLYCFLLAQGFAHTRDIRAYARRLLLLACVSEIPFDLLIFGRLSSAMEQNVVFWGCLRCARRGRFPPVRCPARSPFWR